MSWVSRFIVKMKFKTVRFYRTSSKMKFKIIKRYYELEYL